MEPMTSLSPTFVAQDQSKADRVYHELRRRIRELTLPPGEVIRKEEIALEMGVSRAPVSEAIARLAEEALVDVFPQHGSFVAPIRAQDVRESLLIRTALEVEAIRRVTLMNDSALMATLEENLKAQATALEAGDLALFYDLDEALHAAIFSALKAPRALRNSWTPLARRWIGRGGSAYPERAARRRRWPSTGAWSMPSHPETPSSPPRPCAPISRWSRARWSANSPSSIRRTHAPAANRWRGKRLRQWTSGSSLASLKRA